MKLSLPLALILLLAAPQARAWVDGDKPGLLPTGTEISLRNAEAIRIEGGQISALLAMPKAASGWTRFLPIQSEAQCLVIMRKSDPLIRGIAPNRTLSLDYVGYNPGLALYIDVSVNDPEISLLRCSRRNSMGQPLPIPSIGDLRNLLGAFGITLPKETGVKMVENLPGDSGREPEAVESSSAL